MRLTLTGNIGTRDCKRFDLEPEDALEGREVDVKADAAKELLARGWAVPPDQARTTTADVTAGPADGGVLRGAEPPDFDGMTVEELRDFARANDIDAPAHLNKPDLIKQVKKFNRNPHTR